MKAKRGEEKKRKKKKKEKRFQVWKSSFLYGNYDFSMDFCTLV